VSAIGRESERALKNLERALGRPSFRWNGVKYPCVPGKSKEELVFSMGGAAPDNTLVLNVRMGVLPKPGPQSKQLLTHDDYSWRIETVSEAPDGAWVKITCSDPNAGA
jgi:hypothetical protein